MTYQELKRKAKILGINSHKIKKVELEILVAEAEAKLDKEISIDEKVIVEEPKEEVIEEKEKDIVEVLKEEKKDDWKEQFVSRTLIDKFIHQMGYSITELDADAGKSIRADVRHIYLREVKKGTLIYLRKKI